MNYRKYLKSNHWTKVKINHYKKKKNRRCFLCKAPFILHVHHRYYYRKRYGCILYKELKHPHVIYTLCNDCHSLWHQYQNSIILKRKYKKRVFKLIKLGFSKAKAIRNCSGRQYKKSLKELRALRAKKIQKILRRIKEIHFLKHVS